MNRSRLNRILTKTLISAAIAQAFISPAPFASAEQLYFDYGEDITTNTNFGGSENPELYTTDSNNVAGLLLKNVGSGSEIKGMTSATGFVNAASSNNTLDLASAGDFTTYAMIAITDGTTLDGNVKLTIDPTGLKINESPQMPSAFDTLAMVYVKNQTVNLEAGSKVSTTTEGINNVTGLLVMNGGNVTTKLTSSDTVDFATTLGGTATGESTVRGVELRDSTIDFTGSSSAAVNIKAEFTGTSEDRVNLYGLDAGHSTVNLAGQVNIEASSTTATNLDKIDFRASESTVNIKSADDTDTLVLVNGKPADGQYSGVMTMNNGALNVTASGDHASELVIGQVKSSDSGSSTGTFTADGATVGITAGKKKADIYLARQYADGDATATFTMNGGSVTLKAGDLTEDTTAGNAELVIGYHSSENEASDGKSGNVVGTYTSEGANLTLTGGVGGTSGTNENAAGSSLMHVGYITSGDKTHDSPSEGTAKGTFTATGGTITLTGGNAGEKSSGGDAKIFVGDNRVAGSSSEVTGDATLTNVTTVITGGKATDAASGGEAAFHVGSTTSEKATVTGTLKVTGGSISIVGGDSTTTSAEAKDYKGGAAKLHVGVADAAEGVTSTGTATLDNATVSLQGGSGLLGGTAEFVVTGDGKLTNGSTLNIIGVKDGTSSTDETRAIAKFDGTLTLGSEGASDKSSIVATSNGELVIGNNGRAEGVSTINEGGITNFGTGSQLTLNAGTLNYAKGSVMSLTAGARVLNKGTINIAEGSSLNLGIAGENTTYNGGLGTVNASGPVNGAMVNLTLVDVSKAELKKLGLLKEDATESNDSEQTQSPQEPGPETTPTVNEKYPGADKLTIMKGSSIELASLKLEKNATDSNAPQFIVQQGATAVIGGTVESLNSVILPQLTHVNTKADTIIQIGSTIDATGGIVSLGATGDATPTAAAEPTPGTIIIGNEGANTLLLVNVSGKDSPAPFTVSNSEGSSFTIAGEDKTSVVILNIDDVIKDGSTSGKLVDGFKEVNISEKTGLYSAKPLYDLAWKFNEDGSLSSEYDITINEEERNKEALNGVAAQASAVGVLAMNMTLASLWDHGSKLAGYNHKRGMGDLWIDLNWNHSKVDYSSSGFDTGFKGDLYGATFGGDYQFLPGLAAGLSFSVGSGESKGKGVSSGVKSDTTYYGTTLYAVSDLRYVNLIGNLSWIRADNKLKGSLGKPKVKADIIQTGIRAEVPLYATERLSVYPHIGVNYVYTRSKSFNYGDIHYEKADANFFQFPIGIAAMGNFQTASGLTFKPFVDLQITPTAGKNKLTNDYSVMNFTGEGASSSFDSRITSKVMYNAKLGINATKGRHSLGLHFGIGKNGGSGKQVDTALLAKYRYVF